MVPSACSLGNLGGGRCPPSDTSPQDQDCAGGAGARRASKPVVASPRPRSRRTTLFETYSEDSGRIRVEQRGQERRLLVGGEIQSIYPTDGDWSRLRREYWARALTVPLRPYPRVLLIGLGGATQVHLLQRQRRPRLITIVERDAMVIRIAQQWFGFGNVGGVEVLCTDAIRAIRHLMAARRRFDFIMDDISYAVPIEEAVRTALPLARLLAPSGRLVLNQHTQAAARAVAEALSPIVSKIWRERVRRGTENLLIFADACGRAGIPQGIAGTVSRR